MTTSPKGIGNLMSRTRLSALLARTGLPRVPPRRSRPPYLRAVREARWYFPSSSVYEPLPRRRSVTRLVVRSYVAFWRAVRLEYRSERGLITRSVLLRFDIDLT